MRMVHCILLGSLVTGCAESGDSLGQADQALAEEETAVGEQDVPLPGSETLTEGTEGPPVAAPPPDPELLASQEQYLAIAEANVAQWEAVGFSDLQMEALLAPIRIAILGEEFR